MQYLHDNKIIYRDLKSDNVLAWKFPDPQDPIPVYGATNVLVKLSDYGISQFVATQGARGLVGTPGFMAPEMLKYQGKEVYKCAIYALIFVCKFFCARKFCVTIFSFMSNVLAV